MKNVFGLALLSLIFSCAFTKHENLEDGTINVRCGNWKSACDKESERVCGLDNFEILEDKNLGCYTHPNQVTVCRWQYNIKCTDVSKIPKN